MFVNIRQRATVFALFATLVLGLSLPAQAQNAKSTPTKKTTGRYTAPLPVPVSSYRGSGRTRPVDSGASTGMAMVPTRRGPMKGNGIFIPSDVPVRSTVGVTGFKKATSRVRIGGANGASVTEKVVNLTQTPVPDERVPVWTVDERFLYFAGNSAANPGRYNIYRIASDEPTDAGANTPVAISNPANTGFDYYFPVINLNQTRVAFVRSSDGKDVDDPTKKWDLYVADLPANGQFLDTEELGANNLRKLTEGRDFPNGQGGRARFATVGRPAWVGSTDVVFSAQLEGDPNFHLFSVNIQTRVIFQLTAGAGDERNPSASPDGRYIAFDSNAESNTTGGTYVSAPADPTRRVRTETDPAATPAGAGAVGNTRNIFIMGTLGQNVRQFTLQYPGAPAVSSFHPTWSSTQKNNFINPNGDDLFIGFASDRIPTFASGDTTQNTVTGWNAGPANTSSIYYAVVSRNQGNTLLGEADPTNLDGVDADGARRLDTANDTLQGGILNDQTRPRFRDQYPTFAPFVRVTRMSCQSNRVGSYAKDGIGTGFTVTNAKANNLFIASLIDITAPTLIRFDTSSPTGEVVHINLVTNDAQPYNPDLAASVRNRSDGITPGSKVHFAVRFEDRESGMRPENSSDGKAVYLQIKNPNSRYQSAAQGASVPDNTHRGEHKEFYDNFTEAYVEGQTFISWANRATGYNVGTEFEAQAISAISTTDAAAGTNNFPTDVARGTPYYSHEFNTFGDGPLYVPSFNDRVAFSGTFGHFGRAVAPLDGGTYTVYTGAGVAQTITTPNVWLHLRPLVQTDANGQPVTDANGNTVPVRPVDGKGGVLYGASWVTPSDASDWYIDVIAYDNAVNPYNPNERSNVIIYDNVWGFSTAAPISGLPQDILVVSDYTLGQKFFASRFGTPTTDDRSTRNLQPLFWGTESYFTDVDLQRFPSEQAGQEAPFTGTTPPNPPNVWDRDTPFQLSIRTNSGVFGGNFYNRSGYPNVLGVSSYNDEILDSSAVFVDAAGGFEGYKLPVTGRYSIYRVLSRGPVPAALLQDYLPQQTVAPADTARGETVPRTVLSVNRMVVWASPFTGNLFTGAGSLTDIQTQNDLTSYVQSGGRLLISGQDIGFALAGNGQNNFFFNNILKASYLTDGGGQFTGIQAATFSGNSDYVLQLTRDPWTPATGTHAYGAFTGGTLPWQYRPLDTGAPGGNGIVRYVSNTATLGERVGDASQSANSDAGFVDRIRANPGVTPTGTPAGSPPDSVDLFLFPGSPAPPAFPAPGAQPTASATIAAIIGSAVPSGYSAIGRTVYDPARSGQRIGKVVYAAAGFESISQGWYNYATGTPSITYRATLGRRAVLMHNITCHFRTGSITGRVLDNEGKPVNDALVRAVPDVVDDTQVATGTALTDENGNFQIIGLPPGFYVLFGYKAGFYTQHNLGNTVHGGWRAAADIALKAAGPGALSGVQRGTGQQNPQGGVFSEDGVTPISGIEIQVRRREVNGLYTKVVSYSSDGSNRVVLPDGSSTQLPAGAYLFPALLISDYQVVANSIFTVRDGRIVEKEIREFRDANGAIFRAHVNDDGSPVKEQYGEVRIGVSPASQYRLGTGVQVIPDPNPGSAQPIGPTVRISENVTAQVDFLLPARPQRITGRVLNQDNNQPIEDAIVTATRKSDGTLVAQGTTDANGVYTLSRINPPAGDPDPTLLPGATYVVSASANGFSPNVPPSEANNLDVVVGGQLEQTVTAPDIRLKTLPPGSVSGLVRRFAGSQPTTSATEGATVDFYAVQVVGGQQVQSPNISYTATVGAVQTTSDGYQFNFRIAEVLPGTYNAYVSKPGLSGNPSPFANITVTTGAETRNINFILEPPKIYGQGLQLISVPQDYSAVVTRDVFGITANGDNDGDGTAGSANDTAIHNIFNVADWSGTSYQTSPDLRLRLGKGYFVRFGDQAAIATSGAPTQATSFRIDLSRGWNLIGHPFSNQVNPSDPAADIDISAPSIVTYSYVTVTGVQRTEVSLAQAVSDNALQGVLYNYTGSENGSLYQPGSRLKQWFGYWIRAFVPVRMTLRYPGTGTRAVKAGTKSGGVFKSITRAERELHVPLAIASKNATDWRLQIAARQGNLADTENSVGVAPDAHEGFDNQYDHEKPPMVGEAPALYVGILGKDMAGRATTLSSNVAAPANATTFEFTVQTTADGPVTVYWPNVSRLPRGLEPVLVDTASGKRVAMRSGSSSYTFTPNGRAEHRFRVEVSAGSSLPLDILNLRTASRDISGGGSYRFSFTTTRAVNVNAEIRTLTGKRIKRFQSRAAGGVETSVVWDGRDEAGQMLPPGPYVLTVTAQDDRGASVSRRVSVLKNQ
ncbi:MAG: carboxypeptidase regulatory-like domain-containing protein [Capsulimonadales bacterium]|nr:carboxypeptidase regulatory-like domain-containing protein [Capsulimonadales bacterium]